MFTFLRKSWSYPFIGSILARRDADINNSSSEVVETPLFKPLLKPLSVFCATSFRDAFAIIINLYPLIKQLVPSSIPAPKFEITAQMRN